MPHPLSSDLRERVVAYVEAGHSCHEAADHFATSVSFAVNLMRLWRETGRVDPRPRGGFRHGKLAPHRDFILATIAARSDITMPEVIVEGGAFSQRITFNQAGVFKYKCRFHGGMTGKVTVVDMR